MIPEIIKDACGGKLGGYDLTRLYPHGRHVYGTDGRIMIRCPIEDVPDIENPSGRRPNLEGPVRMTEGSAGIQVPLPDASEYVDCDACGGTGDVQELECVCGERFELQFNGEPVSVDCPECDGAGVIPNMEAIRVCDDPRVYLLARYVAMLRRHGVFAVDVRKDAPATFSGPGFEGWLMPMDIKTVEQKFVSQ